MNAKAFGFWPSLLKSRTHSCTEPSLRLSRASLERPWTCNTAHQVRKRRIFAAAFRVASPSTSERPLTLPVPHPTTLLFSYMYSLHTQAAQPRANGACPCLARRRCRRPRPRPRDAWSTATRRRPPPFCMNLPARLPPGRPRPGV